MRTLFLFLLVTNVLKAQQIQFHRDFRHTIDPKFNSKDFYYMNFEYLKDNDSVGSFLFKLQVDFEGKNGNQSKSFLQVSKNFRYWNPKIFLSLGYSGGLGFASSQYGYHINNSYSVGLAYPFQWKGYYCSLVLGYRYNSFSKVSNDTHMTFYFWKGLLNYKMNVSGSFVSWTQNRNLGSEFTENLSGKKICIWADPQLWYKMSNNYSLGTRINLLYNLIEGNDDFKIYPSIGIMYEF